MAIEHYKALRILAMAEVLRKPSSASYALRQVFRWYSEHFHTPLHIVEQLPLEDVLQHYYEAQYELLLEEPSGQKLQEELVELTETEEQAASRRLRADREEFDKWLFEKEVEAEKEAQERAAAAKAKAPKKGAAARLSKPKEELPFAEEMPAEPGAASMPTPGAVENIKMSFVDLEELDRLAEADGLAPLVGLD